MLKSLLQLFETKESEEQQKLTVELATAALLSEIIRADDNVTDSEISAYKSHLFQQFELSDDELKLLMDEGRSSAEDAVDLIQFTKIINQKCDADEKREILEGLWSIAYADNQLAPIEEHIIRRISDLLHVSHAEFIKTKLAVTQNS
ncbi:TerB family tellurite resistance protein [Alteromonas sp. 1_MG-2023]|uniref:tellurite resistance TerB family protein n=1 Tax=Alteromonas sp. 1_MG-2023 TaxID=3062669 RepID=UPI0026E15D1E|nr:TerB family tellurite resistance protein [Alteromonas sp. 1_MG-2023]MDO6567039.1 TerB family tellurite resistance protein [Alteromonas sp. 1_MG-2023]